MVGLVGYVGGTGSGKTVHMVIDTYRDWAKDNIDVVSNLDLTFPSLPNRNVPKKFKLIDLIRYMDDESEWDNISLAWDEIYVNLECRISSSSELNRIASYFALQSRKRRVRIKWTSQRFGLPDNRLRWLTYEVGELIKDNGIYTQCPLIGNQQVNATASCWLPNCPRLESCIATRRHWLKYFRWTGNRWKKYTLDNVQQFFKLFNTEQIVSYRETDEVNAYLAARKRKQRQDARDELRGEESTEKVINALNRMKKHLPDSDSEGEEIHVHKSMQKVLRKT